MFEKEVGILKSQFAKIDQGLSFADMGAEGVLNRQCENVAQRFVALHVAIMRHTIMTLELAIDQISICGEVARAMYFYQDEIVNNPEFWLEETNVNDMLLNNNDKMVWDDMQLAMAIMNGVFVPLTNDYHDGEDADLNRGALIKRYNQLPKWFFEEMQVVSDLKECAKMGLPLFDADQKPTIKDGETAEKTLKAIHLKSALNAEMAFEHNLHSAQNFMTAVQLVQSRGCPQNLGIAQKDVLEYLTDRLELVLERLDVLQDAADNRHGFTQLRFG